MLLEWDDGGVGEVPRDSEKNHRYCVSLCLFSSGQRPATALIGTESVKQQ